MSSSLKNDMAAFIEKITDGYIDENQVDSMKETPQRWVKMIREVTGGYMQEPAEILAKTFKQKFDQMIIVDNIDFTSTCEHHLLPFVGVAHVAYLPGASGTVVGLSKIPRLVDCFARRFQLQERMTEQIAESLQTYLEPAGVGVIVKAQHQCMSCRGVRKTGASMITSALLGEFRTDPQVRAEFLRLM